MNGPPLISVNDAFVDEQEVNEDYLSFENFAMLLNLINNVYIKNNIVAKSSSQIIDEEEEGSDRKMRPFGFVDSFNRFMVQTQAEVDKIY